MFGRRMEMSTDENILMMFHLIIFVMNDMMCLLYNREYNCKRDKKNLFSIKSCVISV